MPPGPLQSGRISVDLFVLLNESNSQGIFSLDSGSGELSSESLSAPMI